jgi:molybdopterin adenylyltransferase
MFRVGILTVSDKGHAGERQDTAGPELGRLLDPGCFQVAAYQIVPDEWEAIVAQLVAWSDQAGLVPGIPEAMRAASLAVTPHAMLSRGVAVIRGRTLILNLPGSPKGARENLEAVAAALPHALEKLQGSPAECGAE